MSCVYKHTFPNGAVYIGRTNMKPEDRWLNGWGYKQCPLMFAAILQFGWNNVKHEILADNLTEKESIDIEAKEIARYNENHTLYNLQGSPVFVKRGIKKHKRNIIPLTEKPQGCHSCSVDVYTVDGDFICNYPSTKIAAQELCVNPGDITSCCKGVRSDGQPRYQVKGYIFRYGKS